MNIYKYDIVFQEVPHHISMGFYVCGCQLHCPGCHSPELWSEHSGFLLTEDFYLSLLESYHKRIDCVLFFGGEWLPQELINFLKQARLRNIKTALYTGEDAVNEDIMEQLTFLKTGPWKKHLGGLSSFQTNQVFKDLRTNTVLNHYFQTQIK